ncbi:MAG: hypothetical protein RL077_4127 [Verrucomicrobiota bacterium]|jgi:pimeloyl-ACP methyl ester carboxylesterase
MVTRPPLPEWLAREYPFTPQIIRTRSGAEMSFLDEGPRTAEAVLMVHGNPTWSYYYRHLVQTLAPQARCIAPDHVGMGASEKPANYDYSLDSRINDLDELVESLGLKKVHLVVHDWGGAIGFGWAARRPEKIGRIVILNTGAFALDRIPLRIALCRTPLIGPVLVRALNGFAWPATWMAMHRRSLSPDEQRGYLWPYDSWAHRVAVDAFVRDIPMARSHPSRPALDRVEAGLAQFRHNAILIAWGESDFCFNNLFLQRWQEIFPGAQVHRLADAGHYVLDDARDEILPRLKSFLLGP